MIGVKITAIGKDNFFDSEAVIKALSESQRKVLSKFGAYVRTRARSSIRPAAVENKAEVLAGKKAGQKVKKRFRPSAPGEPPRSRQGDLKKFILFGYEPADGNVVIGPTLVGGRASDTPHRLEFGGEMRMRNRRIVKVKARPFMRPAFEKEMARMPAMFADSLFGR